MGDFHIIAELGAGDTHISVKREGFNSVDGATRALFELLGELACHWGELAEDGASATGYVVGDGYQDTYNVDMN